jgi:Lrp/AsnC family transcriptional regulator, leucine-responsive regulatory protein
MQLDRYDLALIRVLQHEARITNAALAERVNLSESACLRRVRSLEKSGLIQGYVAVLDQQKAGYPVDVFVNITLDRQQQADLAAFEAAVRKVPEVMECYLMSGEFDYLLRVAVTDNADFERVHALHLTRLPGVSRVHSSFALRTVQKSSALPLRHARSE